MAIFHVVWKIGIDAKTPEEAAKKALEIQQDSTSLVAVFEVTDILKGASWRVDLNAEPKAKDRILSHYCK